MYNGYVESQSKVEERRARIISALPPRNAWEPTLDECLAMEAEIRAEKLQRMFARWEGVEVKQWSQEVKKLAEEMTR